jgi:hypothetical protein
VNITASYIAIVKSWKASYVMIGGLCAMFAFIAADTSPYTPWILGLLVPIGVAIIVQLWRMEGRIAKVETQITPFWASLQTKIADALHHPHPESKELDGYLEKLENLELNDTGHKRLKILLQNIVTDPNVDAEEKAKAKILLAAVPIVQMEAAGDLVK